jgi:hypothetical protein
LITLIIWTTSILGASSSAEATAGEPKAQPKAQPPAQTVAFAEPKARPNRLAISIGFGLLARGSRPRG